MSRSQILEFVDEHEPTRPLRRASGDRVAEQYQQSPINLIVEIDDALPLERRPVRGPRCSETVNVAVVALFSLVRIDQAEPDYAECLDPGTDRITISSPRKGNEITDDAANVRFVDGSPGTRLRRERCDAVDDCQRHCIQCPHLEPRNVGCALLHLLLCPLVECDEADSRWRQVPVLDQMARPLGQYSGLPRSGWGNNAGPATGVDDSGQLIGGQVGFGFVRARRHERVMLDRHEMQHGHVFDGRYVANRAGVEPHDLPVRQRDIPSHVGIHWSRPSSDRHVEREPGRIARVAPVDGVGPHEVV